LVEIRPPAFPLTPAAFRRALRTGHGRALRQVRDHGSRGLEDAILDAALRCPVFDPQCEGCRADWVAEIIATAGLADTALAAVARVCTEPEPSVESFWDGDHQCDLLREFAARELPGARELLYSMLARESRSADVIAAEQIVELDGAEGLLFVARAMGRWLTEDAEFWANDGPMQALDESTGVGAARSTLGAAAAHCLMFVYEQSPCSNCKCDAVELLTSLQQIPPWVLEEMRLDARNEIRDLASGGSTP
jgi:hypothetical protein